MLDEMKKKVKEDKELDLEAQRRIAASAMVMFTQSGLIETDLGTRRIHGEKKEKSKSFLRR